MGKQKLYITTTIPESLGFFCGQIQYLSSEFNITVVSSPGVRLKTFGEKENCNTYPILMKRGIAPIRDFIGLCHFILLFVKQHPDIVHGNTPKASFLSMLAAYVTGIKTRIYMCHGLRYQGCTGLMRKLLINMERISCLCATDVFCVSRGLMDQLLLDKICSKKKLSIILNGSINGIDLNRYDRKNLVSSQQLKNQLNLPQQNFIFLFVGRIVKDKGIEELISAFCRLQKQYSTLSLLLVGKYEAINPITEEVKNIIETNHSIHWVGSQADVRPFYGCSDVMVLPSYREGFGMVLMEACAMDVPCITTDIIGCNEIIVNGQNGLVIPKQDSDALYEAMKYMYEHPQERLAMASCARKTITSRYRQQDVWKAALDTYKALG